MSVNYGELTASTKKQYVYLPKVGQENTFDIKVVNSIKTGLDKFHFIKKEKITLPDGTIASADKNLGYHIECELQDGRILSVTSFGAFIAVFAKHDIKDGDKVFIKHVEKGVWEVKKLNG